MGGVYPTEGIINGKGQRHYRSLPRNVLGILSFRAIFEPWMGEHRGDTSQSHFNCWNGFGPSGAVAGGACGLCPGLGLEVLVGLLMVPVGAMGSFWPGVSSFWVWGGGGAAFWCWAFAVWVLLVLFMGAVVGVFWGISKLQVYSAHLAFQGLSWWEASVTLCLWFRL